MEKGRWKRKENLKGLAIVGGMMLLIGMTLYIPRHTDEFVSVSNSVNGRELPIYCVQCEEPKVALSFDAAWGNVRVCNLKMGTNNVGS